MNSGGPAARRAVTKGSWVGVAVLFGATVTGVLYWGVRERSRDFYQDKLVGTAQGIATKVDLQVRMAGAFVDGLAGFFENTQYSTDAEFSAFAARTARDLPGFFAASWQQRVRGGDRAVFEAEMQAAGWPDYRILDRDPDRSVHPAPPRDSYLPITYTFAPFGDGPPMGVDLEVLPAFIEPKWRAVERGRPSASQQVPIGIGTGPDARVEPGFVISAGVLAAGPQPARERLRGFASATFKVQPMMAAATAASDLTGLRVSLTDNTVTDAPACELGSLEDELLPARQVEPYVASINFAGRPWTLRVTPTSGHIRGVMAHLPAVVLGAGSLFTLALGVLIAHRMAERQRRKRFEHERRAAERKFHEVVENMAGAVSVFGVRGAGAEFVVWDLNAAASGLVHPQCPAIIGGTLAEVFGEELHAPMFEAMRRVWATGRPERLPPISYSHGGHTRWLSCNLFRLGSGEIVAVCNDLTAQKEVEQESRQARAELELALDASRVGLWSWDLGLHRARIDARAAAILDVGSTQTLQSSDFHDRVPTEDRERLRTEARAAVAQAREFEAEVRYSARDGSWRRLCLRARPMPGPDGAMRQLVGCVWDATRRRNEEDNLQQRQRLESVATLAGGIAHDLNNALAPLSMGLDLLRLKITHDTEAAETLHSMAASTRRAAGIVKQLSGLARGGVEVTIAAAPTRILDTLREQLRDAYPPGILVEVAAGESELPMIQVGARPMHQVLENLCVNAREAMRASGRLTVSARVVHVGPSQRVDYPELSQGAYVAFVVQDTGPGIPAAIRSRIFDPFFTTKETGRGTGLGLSTALSIVRSCRGTIRVDSRDGEGTRFTVLVPVAPERARTAVAAGTSTAPGVTLRGRTVLLADDDPMVREVARRVLETAGMRVLVAHDGREAIDIFARDSSAVDLVVLDLVMPEVDGPTAGAAIRRIRPDVPMLGASGYAGENALEQARNAGFTSFLPKPYTMDGLLDALRAALVRPVTAERA